MARTFFLEKLFYESSAKSALMKLHNLSFGHSPCSLTKMLSKAYTNKQLGEDLKPRCLAAIVFVSLFFIRMELCIFLNFTLNSFTFLICQLPASLLLTLSVVMVASLRLIFQTNIYSTNYFSTFSSYSD